MMATLQDMESLLYEAIRAGDLTRVKRMVNSSIGRNAVLHTPSSFEAATILGTAAYLAKMPILVYLLDGGGSSINFQDPATRRNALHWACISQHTHVIGYLIRRGADINALDRDNMSPVMVAALHGHQLGVVSLVEAGASVKGLDRLRCSALHYAAFHGHRHSVRSLVLGGCLYNNAIFVKGTPLGNLVANNDVENVQLLLAAGLRVTLKDWEQQQCEGGQRGSEVYQLVEEHVRAVPSLKQVCRGCIRRSMNGQRVRRKISQLPLPSSLIDYLLLAPY